MKNLSRLTMLFVEIAYFDIFAMIARWQRKPWPGEKSSQEAGENVAIALISLWQTLLMYSIIKFQILQGSKEYREYETYAVVIIFIFGMIFNCYVLVSQEYGKKYLVIVECKSKVSRILRSILSSLIVIASLCFAYL